MKRKILIALLAASFLLNCAMIAGYFMVIDWQKRVSVIEQQSPERILSLIKYCREDENICRGGFVAYRNSNVLMITPCWDTCEGHAQFDPLRLRELSKKENLDGIKAILPQDEPAWGIAAETFARQFVAAKK